MGTLATTFTDAIRRPRTDRRHYSGSIRESTVARYCGHVHVSMRDAWDCAVAQSSPAEAAVWRAEFRPDGTTEHSALAQAEQAELERLRVGS
jgi:hypothetical protein